MHAIGEIEELGEDGVAENFQRAHRAAALVALRDDFGAPVQLGKAIGKLPKRNELRAVDVGDLPFMGLADVDEDHVALRFELGRQLLYRYLETAGRRTVADPAERLVVDQLADRGVLAADGAVRIFPQLELAEPQLERVEQHQPADQRIPRPDDPLDGFERLNAADDARQHAEHAAFGATRDQSRRGWLRIEATIAGTFVGVKDRRLAFKTEDAAVDVGLPEQDAGIVHEIAGLEVVGAIDHDVVLSQDIERVGGGGPALLGFDRNCG